jgi:6-phosphogluconolactonase
LVVELCQNFGFHARMNFRIPITLALCVLNGFARTELLFTSVLTPVGPSKGIYSYELNTKDGSLKQVGLAAETPQPIVSWRFIPTSSSSTPLTRSTPTRKKRRGRSPDFASIQRVESSPKSTTPPLVDRSCHLSVDRSGKYVLVANYGGGSVEALPINAKGELGEPTTFIHTHRFKREQTSPGRTPRSLDQRGCEKPHRRRGDLGLDKLFLYRLDPLHGTLKPNDPPFAQLVPGSGPRHFAFIRTVNSPYCINELASTATAFSYNADHGALTELQTISTLPNGPVPGNSTAEIQVSSLRKVCLRLQSWPQQHRRLLDRFERQADARRKRKHPRQNPAEFRHRSTGEYLIAANQDSDTLAVFKIDQKSGALDPVGEPVNAPKPFCVKFLSK